MAAVDGLYSVQTYRSLIEDHLDDLARRSHKQGIEPSLSESDCNALVVALREKGADPLYNPLLDTVFRDRFYRLLAGEKIDSPSFTPVWNLLDVVAILSNYELCEPTLIFWLVEELLDSQTIDGCRKVFDYLESRRELITGVCDIYKCLL